MRGPYASALIATTIVAGCTGTPARPRETTSSTIATGGGTSASVSTSTAGAGGAGTMLPSALSDEGLVVRYYLDEPDMSLQLEDAGPMGIDLDVLYGGELSLGGEAGRRGMMFVDGALQDGASQLAADPMVVDVYDGATAMTYEVVVDVNDAVVDASRVIHFGTEDNRGTLSLVARSTTELGVSINDEDGGYWQVPFNQRGRSVIHLVFDASRDEDQRARLYVDGSPAVRDGGPYPTGEPLAPAGTDRLWLGNRDEGDRALVGTIGYAAIYARAFDEVTIIGHAALLRDDDDTP